MNTQFITELNQMRLRIESAWNSAGLASLAENDWLVVDNAVMALLSFGMHPLKTARAIQRGMSRPGATHSEFQQACAEAGIACPSEMQCVQINCLFKPSRPWIMAFILSLNAKTAELINACRAVGETSQNEINAYRKRYQLRMSMADAYAEAA